jgi:hypothetical protein
MLRRGIRGGTVRKSCAFSAEKNRAQLLQPSAEVGDRIDLWLGTCRRATRGSQRSIGWR